MAYRTLLAHLSNEAVSPSVIAAATILAERHGAHLIGLHLQPPIDLFVGAEIPIPLELTRRAAEQQRKLVSTIKRQFSRITESQAFVSEWRSVDTLLSSVVDTLVEQVNTSDLLIISRSEGDASDAYFRNLPEHVLTASGRPVLVVPDGDPIENLGERIFIAWDGRRESTRAIFGALPALRQASIVRLHRINRPHQDRHHVGGVTEELANTLARHGVTIEVCHSDAHQAEIADELLAFATDMDADMMVMGCYGHSPLREFILGGTTRRVLANTRLPVLMSN